MGSINVRKETGNLVLDFRYRNYRCREHTALEDSPANRKKLQKILDRIELEIKLGSFEYARFFPGSKLAARFGGAALAPTPAPAAPIAAAVAPLPAAARPSFRQFAETWQQESAVAWRRSYQRTVRDIVRKHLEPAFGQRDVGSLSREELLQFRSELAKVKGRKKETGRIMLRVLLSAGERCDQWRISSCDSTPGLWPQAAGLPIGREGSVIESHDVATYPADRTEHHSNQADNVAVPAVETAPRLPFG